MRQVTLLFLLCVATAQAAPSPVAPGPKVIPPNAWTGPSGYSMVKVPAGSFSMGSPGTERSRSDDETLHRVTLTTAYWMGTTEVTQALWTSVMGSNPSEATFRGLSLIGDHLPVQHVDWCDAVALANRLSVLDGLPAAYTGVESCEESKGTSVGWDRSSPGYRLPTKAEWEHAARAGQAGLFAGEPEESGICRVGNVGDAALQTRFSDASTVACNDGAATLAPVGQYAPNPHGLYGYSTVTDFARLRGRSTLQPRASAMCSAKSCSGSTVRHGDSAG